MKKIYFLLIALFCSVNGFAESIPTIAEVIAMENETETKVKGTVTYVAGKHFWIQDATAGILCYGANELKEGDVVTLSGVKTIYRGSPELTNVTVVAKEVGKEVNAQIVTLSDILADSVNGYATYLSEMVYIEGVTISGYKGNYKDPYITDGFNEIQLYNWKDFTEDKYPVGTKVSLKAVLSIYDTTLQLRGKTEWLEVLKRTISIFCDEAQGTVSGAGEYAPGTQVTITATAKEGYQFSYWRIYYNEWDYNTVYKNPYTFEMGSQFYDIEAIFEEIPSYNVNVSSSNEYRGIVIGGGTYFEGDTAVVIATPNDGYVFDYWYDSYYGNYYYSDTLQLEVYQTYNLTAYFRIAPTLVDGIYYYLDKENFSAVVALSEDYTGDIVLPETVTHNRTIYDVTGIEYNAFGGTSITSLVVPNNIHSEITLYECYDLKVLKAHADFISDIDGLYATNIEEVYYTGGYVGYVIRIPSLKVIDLSLTENTELYRSLFREDADGNYEGFYNLRKLILPNGLTTIHDRQFESLWLLEEVVIPEGVTEIPDGAFYDCHALSKVTLSKNLTSIGNYAFYSCHALENIVIPEGVTEIGNAAFYGCTYLENIELPYTLEEVGNNAFALCSKIKSIKAKAHTPPTLWAKTFYDVDRNTPVYVAEVAYDDYVADQYWGEFFNIIATPEYNEDPTDVENTDETSVVIYTQGGMLYVEGIETDYNVFDASGRLIYTGRDAQLSLPRGVYMIHLAGETQKVVL